MNNLDMYSREKANQAHLRDLQHSAAHRAQLRAARPPGQAPHFDRARLAALSTAVVLVMLGAAALILTTVHLLYPGVFL